VDPATQRADPEDLEGSATQIVASAVVLRLVAMVLVMMVLFAVLGAVMLSSGLRAAS
jgi:hypothetical protein